MHHQNLPASDCQHTYDTVAADILRDGISIIEHALTDEMCMLLLTRITQLSDAQFIEAGTGRQQMHGINTQVRRDKIHWLSDSDLIERQWTQWTHGLQTHLNRSLFLGLFSYESHFASYEQGAFYKKHLDAFKGSANRVLSTVLYLNPNWQEGDGGELVVYDPANPEQVLTTVQPKFATLVTFLSEEFPHEVLPVKHQRYSIAGWFRVNGSHGMVVDPPR